MQSSKKLAADVERHRARWPLERIVIDPAGFRAEIDALLQLRSAPPAEWPSAHWLEMMFSVPAPVQHDTEACT